MFYLLSFSVLLTVFWIVLGIAYAVYFFWVMIKHFDKDDENDVRLAWVTSVVTFLILLSFLVSLLFFKEKLVILREKLESIPHRKKIKKV